MITPYKLVSLFDMLKFNADEFVSIADDLAKIHIVLTLADPTEDEPEHLRESFGRISAACERIGLQLSVMQADKLIRISSRNSGTTRTTIVEEVAALSSRIQDELSLSFFIHLSNDEAKYFDSSKPNFGQEFYSKFSSAIYEFDEAGKCFAIGRHTATVFHLMRMMEIGIYAVAKCLGIPDPIKPGDRNWGAILKKIKDASDARNAVKPTNWIISGDKEFFESAYASLDAVKTAWRNPTMHVENKYTADEALNIFNAVHGFMVKLSSRMDEQGLPLA